MADAGKIVITPKGKYNSTTTYEWLDEVTYDGKAYIALKTVTGVTPSDDGVNWRLFLEPNDIVAGNLVPTFTEASTRTNIISEEKLSTILGKVKKYFTDLKGHAFNDTVKNLTTEDEGSALDASQGNVLQGEVDEINSNLDTLQFGEVAGGKNLANPKNFVKNKVVAFDTGYITDNPNYFVSGYIEVKPNTTYVRQGASDGSENYSYDENKKPISIIGTKFTTSANTKYVCLSGLAGKENIMMLEEGSVATEYEPYFPSNKMLAEEKADKSETTVNLLNPTLQTTTVNGLTCTNNGDGTYTLNGTASDHTSFSLTSHNDIKGKFKVVGCPKNGSNTTYNILVIISDKSSGTRKSYEEEYGSGIIFENYDDNYVFSADMRVVKGTTVSNLVFKPMLTTNLNATYDDFVPYTGDSGSLNGDVAGLKNDLDKLNSLPIGTIIQIEAEKDTIATTEAKYSWQYLGTSNIQYENGGAYILVANVYRKNN